MEKNYQKELEKIIENQKDKVPTLFLHSCCAPCSSHVILYLRKYFKITVFYYNPNISLDQEYQKRVQEQKRFIELLNTSGQENLVDFVEGEYIPNDFYKAVKGLEDCGEGSERCFACYELRLSKTIKEAQARHYDYAATTLTISPLKNAKKLNEIGEKLCKNLEVNWLYSDFKKKGGFKHSIELSKEYGLYRQDYCGCAFSKAERMKQIQERQAER